MAEFPEVIVVAGQDIKIELVTSLRIGGHPCYGLFDSESMTIKLRKIRSVESMQSTLAHEILHAVIFLTGQGEYLTLEQEEGLVRALENLYYPVLKHLVQEGHC